MGKRIRWIWVISLAAALAAIGVQGYWLFNQFRYEMCTYADEIAGEVFHAGQEEFRMRKEEAEMTKGTYIIERQSKYQSGDSVLNGLKNSFGFQLYPKDTTKIHSFRLHLDPNMPDLTADPVHVANVLSNLIENAIKYSGEEVDIDIVVLWNQQGVELTVSDNGFGIAPDERRKVFDKFYRSSHLPDKQIPGIGLGLSYVRQIVEAHHGSVSLRSELGEGTRITINLPTTAL